MQNRAMARVNERVQGLLGGEAQVLQVGLAYGGGHPTTLIWTGLGAAALLDVVLLLATKGAFFLGLMGVIYVAVLVQQIFGKPHWIASTTQGLALVSRGWLGKPKAVLVRTNQREPQGLPARGKWVHVPFGSRRVWMRQDQLQTPRAPGPGPHLAGPFRPAPSDAGGG